MISSWTFAKTKLMLWQQIGYNTHLANSRIDKYPNITVMTLACAISIPQLARNELFDD